MRAASFSSKPIPWKTHERWYEEKLDDPSTLSLLLIDSKSGKMAGQLRFELKNGERVVSISLKRGFRGKGLGAELIQAGTKVLFDRQSCEKRVAAYIRKENTSSIKAFEKSGYVLRGPATMNAENDAILMVVNLD